MSCLCSDEATKRAAPRVSSHRSLCSVIVLPETLVADRLWSGGLPQPRDGYHDEFYARRTFDSERFV